MANNLKPAHISQGKPVTRTERNRQELRSRRNGDPNVRNLKFRSGKPGRCHSGDGHGLTVESEGIADHAATIAVVALPESVAQDRSRCSRGATIVWVESTANAEFRPKYREI